MSGDLGAARRAFGEAVAGRSPAVAAAFAAVPREAFVGAGPWDVVRPPSLMYARTPDADPVHLYADVAVAIDRARQLNNGQPSAHARWMQAAAIARGEAVLHVGCGTGYFTAVLAELAGREGRVDGYDIEDALATAARANLAAGWPQATARTGDASALDRDYDAIYVNAGATHARPEWLRALRRGGRMILPLTKRIPMFPSHGVGVVVRVEHPRASGTRWPLTIVGQVGMFDCAKAREPETEMQLRALLALDHATALVLDVAPHARGAGCLVHHAASCIQRA